MFYQWFNMSICIWNISAYAWHIPTRSIYLTYAWYTFGGHHLTPYIWHILTWRVLRYMWHVFHTYGVTWWTPKFRRVVYQAYVRYIDLVGICQAYFVICLAYTWNILFSQNLELEYFRNMPDICLTKSGIFHIPGGWSVSWCWKEKWRVNVHAAPWQLHDSWVSSISWH